MKATLFSICLFISFSTINASDSSACGNMYNKVEYALLHTKKALKTTNLEHLTYYAERALASIEKAEDYGTECDCIKNDENSYQSIKNLESAIVAKDWEAGRFYSKKTLLFIGNLITALDTCNYSEENLESTDERNDGIVEAKKYDVDQNEVELQDYIATAEQKTKKIALEIDQLIEHILENQKTKNPSPSIEVHQQLYAEKAKELFQKAINTLEQN